MRKVQIKHNIVDFDCTLDEANLTEHPAMPWCSTTEEALVAEKNAVEEILLRTKEGEFNFLFRLVCEGCHLFWPILLHPSRLITTENLEDVLTHDYNDFCRNYRPPNPCPQCGWNMGNGYKGLALAFRKDTAN